MQLTTQHNHPIKSPDFLLTLALFTSALGITVWNPVIADSHTSTEPAPSVLGYESALTGYKTLDGGERATWKQSNDTVGQIGGWRSYANEIFQANPAKTKAENDPEDLVGGESEPLKSAVTTPTPDTNANRRDPTSVTSDNIDIAPIVDKSKAQLAEYSSSRPLTLPYQSAMSKYRPYDDNPPGDWRAANNRVGEIGGWKTYANEAYKAAKQKAQADASTGNTQ